ncbi:hypothetical protein S7711_02772 [Stachybotrys chartarum IBT 7711]|uniref:Efficient mitochondria targeting-associated protein 19 n=1 Tax=Stachybotrys chartarum (strain CBS 109288 / IBT 7711) TaxID=1280523 RepID=A0A084ALY1_STACB|nr:hypothetical protein S7711_02772 [Stachybotrys chartarum IBT 7711]KFA78736.1 hypothetical protein S40288_01656 [Stachybotrys chartarum IBT 40288]
MSSQKPWRDWLYLFIISTQLFGMVALDLVAFYPKSLWEAPSAPLHFLVALRQTYVASSGDPFFAQESHDPWFQIFLYIEGLVQFPLAAYLVYQLASTKPTAGPTELAGLAFGCVTAMGAAACCTEVWHMGPDVLSEKHKPSLLYGTYLPFSIVPTLMAVDMYLRLLPRVQAGGDKAKIQ